MQERKLVKDFAIAAEGALTCLATSPYALHSLRTKAFLGPSADGPRGDVRIRASTDDGARGEPNGKASWSADVTCSLFPTIWNAAVLSW